MAGRKRRGSQRNNPERFHRPDFEPGNQLAVVHGAQVPDRWKPLADNLATHLPTIAPWTARPAFAATVAAWAKAEAQAQIIGNFLNEHGLLDDDGVPKPALNSLDRYEVRAARLRDQLGLTPLA